MLNADGQLVGILTSSLKTERKAASRTGRKAAYFENLYDVAEVAFKSDELTAWTVRLRCVIKTSQGYEPVLGVADGSGLFIRCKDRSSLETSAVLLTSDKDILDALNDGRGNHVLVGGRLQRLGLYSEMHCYFAYQLQFRFVLLIMLLCEFPRSKCAR